MTVAPTHEDTEDEVRLERDLKPAVKTDDTTTNETELRLEQQLDAEGENGRPTGQPGAPERGATGAARAPSGRAGGAVENVDRDEEEA